MNIMGGIVVGFTVGIVIVSVLWLMLGVRKY